MVEDTVSFPRVGGLGELFSTTKYFLLYYGSIFIHIKISLDM